MTAKPTPAKPVPAVSPTHRADAWSDLPEDVPEDVAADLRAAEANMAAERDRLRRRLRNRKLWRVAMLLATAVMIMFLPVAFMALKNAEARADRWVSETGRILDARYLEAVEYVRSPEGSQVLVDGAVRSDCTVAYENDVPALECSGTAPTEDVEWLAEPVVVE